MKLLTTASELENEFRRLARDYDNYYWATAWASSGPILFDDLWANKEKIRKIIVGIHFYQTDPKFIEAFLDHKNVRFIQQPEGTFHPKLYLFTDNHNNWEMIVGSANFTVAAFSRNLEANVLISKNDAGSGEVYNNAIDLVEQAFLASKTFNKEELAKYKITFENHRPKLRSLSGQYGSQTRRPKPIHEVPMMNRSWEEFITGVKSEIFHGLDRRLRVLRIAHNLFFSVGHFNELTEDERKFIAGIPNKLELDGSEDWGYFGSMKGAGIFKNKIKENDKRISKALDQIPLSGQVTKKHYNNFVKFFEQAFSGNYIATATRLLCMKRPDTFVCFDSKNRSALCKDFGIIQSKMDYERYWDDIVERIQDSHWWQNPNPKNEMEKEVGEARAAFLDSLYYEE